MRFRPNHGQPGSYEHGAVHPTRSDLTPTGCADCAHVRMPITSRPKPVCRAQCPRSCVRSGFRDYGFPVLFNRETFQNWRGSKVITTRRFRPSFQDETPDVPERVNFISLRSTQQTGISREDSSPNADGICCRHYSGSPSHLLVPRLHGAPPNGDSNSSWGLPD